MEISTTRAENPNPRQIVEISTTRAENQVQRQNVEISTTRAENQVQRQNVEFSTTRAENQVQRPNVEISTTRAENSVQRQNVEFSTTRAENPAQRQNVDILQSSAENLEQKFAEIHAKLLALQEVLTTGGFVRGYWKTYRGKRLGPYYRVVFLQDRRRRSLYLGSDPQLAALVGRLLENWQRGRRENLYLRRLRKKIRAALRLEKANMQKLLAPLGFRMKGYAIHRVNDPEPNSP
jgi:hypothetical protein